MAVSSQENEFLEAGVAAIPKIEFREVRTMPHDPLPVVVCVFLSQWTHNGQQRAEADDCFAIPLLPSDALGLLMLCSKARSECKLLQTVTIRK
jgi:hypothetical protein